MNTATAAPPPPRGPWTTPEEIVLALPESARFALVAMLPHTWHRWRQEDVASGARRLLAEGLADFSPRDGFGLRPIGIRCREVLSPPPF